MNYKNGRSYNSRKKMKKYYRENGKTFITTSSFIDSMKA